MRRFLFCFVLVGVMAVAEQTPSFNLTVTGEKTWTITVGFGSAELLSRENLSPGQPSLTQTLRAEIEGKALGFLTLKASFNDQLGPGFQDFLLVAEGAPWTGELGRFVVGAEGEGLGVYNKRVLGARVGYTGDGVQASALVTRLEGVSESRLFRGELGFSTATFTTQDPDQPWQAAPYLRAVEGLAFWPLRLPYVEGLTQVKLRVDGTPALWALLGEWGLGYLQEDLAAEPLTPLEAGQFLVLGEGREDLALRVAPAALARKRIQDAIDAHNARLRLTGKDRKSYPFVAGSDLEARFLSALAPFLAVAVDDDLYPLPEARYRRYLLLGERDVVADSVQVYLRRPQDPDFRPAGDPDFADYAWTVLPTEGVLRISFPEGFFAGGAVRVEFSFRREGATILLGLSVVPGSERVYRNGVPLARGVDYTVDYEVGLLILFTPLGPEDELRVDFERQRGGLGVVTDYERGLFGLTLTVPDWDILRLFFYRAQDFGTPGPTTRTMPNTHTVAAVSLAGKVAGWSYDLVLSGSENVFPADDNNRMPTPNRINAIAAAQAPDGEYTIFAHQNGLTVYRDGAFTSYGTAHGLSGRAAYALLALPGQLLVGTDTGLTVVRLAETAPFDRVRSWVRLSQTDGLPGTGVVALARGTGVVYLATESGIASFSPSDAENPRRWQKLPLPAGEPRPTALLWAHGRLYLGTADGVYLQEDSGWIPVPGVAGPVHDLLARGPDVYVASDEGIRILHDATGAGWIVLGKAVYQLALADDVLWYAAQDGLWKEGNAVPTVAGPVTSVGVVPSAIWTAAASDEAFRLHLWRVTERVERFVPSQTKIDGRDLARFRDIPAADHTRYGLSGSLVLNRVFGDWQWEVRASSRLPGYEEIGRPGRSDSHGVGVAARYTGAGPTTLDLRARWAVVDLATTPSGKLSGGLDWRWSDGPTASLSLTPALTGRGVASFSRLETGWQAGLSNRTQAWSWGISTTGSLHLPAAAATGQLGANLSLRPSPSWLIEASWTRPFRTTGTPGDQTFLATLRWGADFPGISISTTWRETVRQHLTTGTWHTERTAQADARWSPWRSTLAEFTPRLSGVWTSTPADWRWEVRFNTDVRRSPMLLRLGVTAGHGVRPDTGRSSRNLALAVTWEHQGSNELRPTLRWERSWNVLSHPRYPDQVTEKEEITLQLVSDPRGASWRNTATLTWNPPQRTLSLTDRLSWTVGSLSATARAEAALKPTGAEAKLSGQIGVPLDVLLVAAGLKPVGEEWGIQGELGYVLASPAAGPVGQALSFGVTLAVRF